MPCASFSMLGGPGGTEVSLTSFLQSEVKIIHIIVQNNTYTEITAMEGIKKDI